MPDYRSLSLWHDTADDDWVPRPALPGDVDCDVAIVGAGYTGLWTAYYLRHSRPDLRVVVLEAEVAGFGASGRNGGWCSAFFLRSTAALAAATVVPAALAMQQAMRDSVDEVGRVVAAEGIDCGFTKGGTLSAARTPQQLERARRPRWTRPASYGSIDGRPRACSPPTRRRPGSAPPASSARCSHHTAPPSTRPASCVDSPGPSSGRAPRSTSRPRRRRSNHDACVTPHGTIRADVVVRATEGFTPRLPGLRPSRRPGVLADGRHRAAAARRLGRDRTRRPRDVHRPAPPDHLRPAHRRRPPRLRRSRCAVPLRLVGEATGSTAHRASSRALRRTLVDLFPVLAGARFTHEWGGPLAIPRDWYAVGRLRPAARVWPGPAATSATG